MCGEQHHAPGVDVTAAPRLRQPQRRSHEIIYEINYWRKSRRSRPSTKPKHRATSPCGVDALVRPPVDSPEFNGYAVIAYCVADALAGPPNGM